jgi:F420-dependent oxidoreductase-like protein
VELRIFTEPQQGATYETQLACAKATREAGFGAWFRSDHYLNIGHDPHTLPGPTDSWVTLGALAREVPDIRFGTMVTSATFRLPGPLAIQVAQVDQMSGGRVELGLGSGWYEEEHRAYGIPFPPLGERFERLEEQLAIVTGLWATQPGSTFSHTGKHYTLVDSPALPKPVQQPRPRIIVGGKGPKRTPNLAAVHADEFNIPFSSLEESREQFRRVRAACAEIGRDPDELTYGVAQTVAVGRDEAEAARRADNIGRDLDELRANGVAGTVDEAVERLRAFAQVGAERVYLQVMDMSDLEHIALLGEAVAPQVA